MCFLLDPLVEVLCYFSPCKDCFPLKIRVLKHKEGR